METPIKTQAKSISELMPIKNALQTIASNVSKENLVWFSEIVKRENFNEKLNAKKGFIKTFL